MLVFVVLGTFSLVFYCVLVVLQRMWPSAGVAVEADRERRRGLIWGWLSMVLFLTFFHEPLNRVEDWVRSKLPAMEKTQAQKGDFERHTVRYTKAN
jgi:hypothetical protein